MTDPYLKIYRKKLSPDKAVSDLPSSIHPFFKNPFCVDVTTVYNDSRIKKFSFPINKLYGNQQSDPAKIVYLCMASYMDWVPVAWTYYTKDSLVFQNIHGGTIARVATWENNRLIHQSDPFYISPELQNTHFFTTNGKTQDITIFSKFGYYWSHDLYERMLHGVFEGSNFHDFRQKDTLYHITEIPYRQYTHAVIHTKSKYRYVRYYGADSTYCNISEAGFYSQNSRKKRLNGQIIGTPGSWDTKHEYTNVFDGATTTSFDYKMPSGGWTGLDLGVPVQITGIVYSPRNRDNFIKAENSYELFFCDRDWISTGQRVASSDSLFYPGILENILLFVKKSGGSIEERIFTYENGKQVWW